MLLQIGFHPIVICIAIFYLDFYGKCMKMDTASVADYRESTYNTVSISTVPGLTQGFSITKIPLDP